MDFIELLNEYKKVKAEYIYDKNEYEKAPSGEMKEDYKKSKDMNYQSMTIIAIEIVNRLTDDNS